jgi:hypothetical protein
LLQICLERVEELARRYVERHRLGLIDEAAANALIGRAIDVDGVRTRRWANRRIRRLGWRLNPHRRGRKNERC